MTGRPPAALHHTGIVVTDLDAAAAFFTEWLGARELFRLERVVDDTGQAPARLGGPAGASFAVAMLEVDGARLELVRWWDGGQDAPSVSAPGTGHVAIGVDDLPAALETLRAHPGMEVLGEPVRFTSGPTPGLANAFVRTPWGVLLELMNPVA